MNNFWSGVVTIVLAIIGVATIAVVVSKNANTSGVIKAGGGALSDLLRVAVSPVSGGMGGIGGVPSFDISF